MKISFKEGGQPQIAKEGRYINPEGTDEGDSHFHEIAFSASLQNEQADQKAMEQLVLDHYLVLLEQILTGEEKLFIYKSLLALFPHHPEKESWETQKRELEI